MNGLLTWISARTVLGSVGNVTYPNFEVKGSYPPFSHELFSEFYNEAGTNPGHDAVDFYEAFRNYLNASPAWMVVVRVIGSLIGIVLWYIAEAMQYFYVKLFGLFRISNITDYAAKGQYSSGHWGVHELFVDANDFGLVIFGIVTLCYICGTIINSPTYARVKNILRNAMFITFFLFCLPWMTSEFGQGTQDVAQDMFPNSSVAQPQDNQNSLANEAYFNNVVSIPTRIESVVPGSNVLTSGPDDGGSSHIYRMGGRPPIMGLDDGARPIMIDMSGMSNQEKNEWNGLDEKTVPQFLSDYAAPSETLNKDVMSDYATAASTIMKQKGQQGANSTTRQNMNNNYNAAAKDSTDPTSSHHIDDDNPNHPYLNKVNGFINHVNDYNPFMIAYQAGASLGADWTQDKYEANYKQLFGLHVGSAGTGAGATAAQKAMNSYYLVGFHSQISKVLSRSYSVYHVNWLSVYAQLIMVCLIIGAYIWKIFTAIFKLVVMYLSSGIMLFRNADNYQRVKAWMRDIFSIYEAAIMNVIMFYVALNIIYPAYHEFNNAILINTKDSFLANPYSVAVIDFIGDLALYMASIKGLNSVNRGLGSSGGGANSGGSGMFGSLIAARVGGTAIRGGMRLGGSAVRGATNGAKGLVKGIHSGFGKGKANGKHLTDGKSNNGDGTSGHTNAGKSNRKGQGTRTGLGHDSANSANGRTQNGKPGNATKGEESHKGLDKDSGTKDDSQGQSKGGRQNKPGNATKDETDSKGLDDSSASRSGDSGDTTSDGSDSDDVDNATDDGPNAGGSQNDDAKGAPKSYQDLVNRDKAMKAADKVANNHSHAKIARAQAFANREHSPLAAENANHRAPAKGALSTSQARAEMGNSAYNKAAHALAHGGHLVDGNGNAFHGTLNDAVQQANSRGGDGTIGIDMSNGQSSNDDNSVNNDGESNTNSVISHGSDNKTAASGDEGNPTQSGFSGVSRYTGSDPENDGEAYATTDSMMYMSANGGFSGGGNAGGFTGPNGPTTFTPNDDGGSGGSGNYGSGSYHDFSSHHDGTSNSYRSDDSQQNNSSSVHDTNITKHYGSGTGRITHHPSNGIDFRSHHKK